MDAWNLICFLGALAVLIAFTNQFVLKLQTTIAITTGSVAISLLLILAVKLLGDESAQSLINVVSDLNFNQILLNGMLGFLLFAGAMEIDLRALRRQRWEITTLVLFSTVVSTVIVGYLSSFILGQFGWDVPFIYCLLFGALISPTDPIAVLAIIKQMQAPKNISIQVEGESLFNDGVGLVIFSTLFAVAFSGVEPTVSSVAELFLSEAVGGIVFGLVLAVVAHFLIVKSPDFNVRLLVTLAIPSAGYALAIALHVSGALAMVMCGIFIGNVTRSKGAPLARISSIRFIKNFWHATDTFLNALLFLLIGMLIVSMRLSLDEILIGLCMIPAVLFARFVSVGAPYLVFKQFRRYDLNSVRILTWGGLRGGLALAMAASIPNDTMLANGHNLHNLMVIVTYIVVIFSIVVQGLTISPLIKKSIAAAQARA
ncbi:Na(+)/H(+) antiporter NhaP [Paraglaciecola mesophila]|uniref:Na(+)/H(+) antiporter NhaP n=1 Tax=Paraglaciecola mesophila TaxID=197222 RepID=A0A857JJE6_9ALTE|nr:sodium:proton antiporter [Paraglaciecola mesophila]QHJ11087.1 Na(+)/H(+) antiporter NhaP [Paraglaciecola mesophila]